MEFFQKTIFIDNLKISYWETQNHNANKTIVLLSPGAWDGGFFKNFLNDYTDKDIRFIAPDYIGRGGTDEIVQFDTIKIVAKYTYKLLQALDLKKTTLMGISFGTMVCDEMVKTDRDNIVEKVVLIAPGEYMNDFQRIILNILFLPAKYSSKIRLLYRTLLVKYSKAFRDFPKDKIGSINEQWISTLNYKFSYSKKVNIPALIVLFKNDILVRPDSIKKINRFYLKHTLLEVDIPHNLTFNIDEIIDKTKFEVPRIFEAINKL